jgi:hypothetical protein
MDLDQIIFSLMSNNEKSIVRSLWAIDLQESKERDKQIFQETLFGECCTLKRLLTENTCIKKAPFLDFAANLGSFMADIRGNYRLHHAVELQERFAEYRRDESNFKPLKASVKALQNGWGTFLCCFSTDFFVLASGETTHILVHFDQWMYNQQQEVAIKYAKAIDDLAKHDDAIVLVNKLYGPEGPSQIWEGIQKKLERKFPVFFYDQAKGSGRFLGETRDRFIVVYDLINSGEGLKDIGNYLRNHGGKDVQYIVLYDYSVGKSLDAHVLYDGKRNNELRPESLDASLAERPFLWPGQGPVFDRTKLEQVDPSAASLKCDADFSYAVSGAVDSYIGKWIAVNNGKVIASSESYNNLMAVVNKQALKPVIRFVEDPESIYGH